jgi:DNA polymerase-4
MPLRYLFVDMNAYFASVEQQDHPELRGRPVGVVPVVAETSCCIAASYEAKAQGVRTGTPVWEARRLCPEIVLALARPERYCQVHTKIVQAVGRCIPVTKILSVDEMTCKLMGDEQKPENAARIAGEIKREIKATAGETLRCSIGVGPSTMLAKVAGDMMKPDGLTFLHPDGLPGNLYGLKITDFPGIGPRMEKRFHRYGITTTQQLMQLTQSSLAVIWGSKVHAARWYALLRGEDVADAPTRRRTVGHEHILAPELRTDDGSRGVLVRLIHKAAARLRTIDYWTDSFGVGVTHLDGPPWYARVHMPLCQDTLNLLLIFAKIWDERPRGGFTPLKVSMTLAGLTPSACATPSLFEFDGRLTKVSHVMDKVNRTFGKNSLHFGTLFGAEDSAPVRVSFTAVPKFNPAFT